MCLGSVALVGWVDALRPIGVAPPVALYRSGQYEQTLVLSLLRGGASTKLGDEDEEVDLDDSSEDVEEDETEDEEEESDKVAQKKADMKMSASAVKAAEKSKAKQRADVKSAVNEGLAEVKAEVKTVTKKKSSRRGFRIPYIIRAALNPLTLFAMTKAYFGSLFNLDYLEKVRYVSGICPLLVFHVAILTHFDPNHCTFTIQDSSQDLRSALEEKAKRSGGGGGKGKRRMKPGQAKTLSDLPQLSQ